MKSIERCMARLGAVFHEAKGKPLRLFVRVVDWSANGFRTHWPEGQSVTRQDGETE